MDRKPLKEVRQLLRQEVGFGCPIPGCGNPYLYWHHFDPPWAVKQHHDPARMIALCGEHHPKADAGAFTKEQLREYKKTARHRRDELVRGKFDWLRHDIIAVIGSVTYEPPPIPHNFIPVLYAGSPLIWFTRDENGFLGLNIRMLTTTNQPRLVMEDNFWIIRGEPTDFECPPSGRLIHAIYSNGDELRIEFKSDNGNRTVVEITIRVPTAHFYFDKDGTSLGGAKIAVGGYSRCVIGLDLPQHPGLHPG